MPVQFIDLEDVKIEDASDLVRVQTFECKYPRCTDKHTCVVLGEYPDYYLVRYSNRDYDEVLAKRYAL